MRTSLRAIAVAAVLILASVGAASCGEDEPGLGSGADGAGRGDAEQMPEPGSAEAVEEKSGVSAFVDTPEMGECMRAAGFAEDAPPTGGLKAWRGPGGARAVVGSGPDVTTGIASEIGSADAPADVDGTVVLSGPQAQRDAAAACLG